MKFFSRLILNPDWNFIAGAYFVISGMRAVMKAAPIAQPQQEPTSQLGHHATNLLCQRQRPDATARRHALSPFFTRRRIHFFINLITRPSAASWKTTKDTSDPPPPFCDQRVGLFLSLRWAFSGDSKELFVLSPLFTTLVLNFIKSIVQDWI